MGTEKTTEATLAQLRFRKLVRALHKHGTGMSAAAIAAKLDASPTLIADVIDAKVHADDATIARAGAAFDVHADYFSREDLGEHTTHESFVGKSPFATLEAPKKSKASKSESAEG